MSDLHVGDRVRVKPLAALGTILRVSGRLRHAPYLVEVEGYGERGFAASDLAKIDPPAAAGAVLAVRGASGAMVCGVAGCWRELDPRVPTCPKCGAAWRLT